jgi:hypothetical protein
MAPPGSTTRAFETVRRSGCCAAAVSVPSTSSEPAWMAPGPAVTTAPAPMTASVPESGTAPLLQFPPVVQRPSPAAPVQVTGHGEPSGRQTLPHCW